MWHIAICTTREMKKKSFLKKKMATYEVPVLIKKMTAFPVTQNGKVRKLELRRITEEGGW